MELEEGVPGVGVLIFANLIATAVVVLGMAGVVPITADLREGVNFYLHIRHSAQVCYCDVP